MISCNFQYRLKSIRLAFLPIYKKARGCTWCAWSARAIHRWRSPGWRMAGHWIPRRRPPIISANTISRWWYRARPRPIMATIRAWRATMPPKRLARHPCWSTVRWNGHGNRFPSIRRHSLLLLFFFFFFFFLFFFFYFNISREIFTPFKRLFAIDDYDDTEIRVSVSIKN